jgi:hypothetical protein
MANVLFDPGREGFLDGTINYSTGVIKVALVRGYTPNQSHRYVSDVISAGGTFGASAVALASKTTTGGVADAADVSFGVVTANANAHSVLIYQSSAPSGGADLAQTSQRLIAWVDTGTGLPITPNGGAISLAWDNGASRIFRL